MPGFTETVTTIQEQTELISDIHTAESPDLSEGVSPEIPASHTAYNIDPATLSVDGLVRVCSHYVKVAEQNPELAKAQAANALQNLQVGEVLREEGKDEETIAKAQWAAMRERRKQKSRTKNEQAAESKDAESAEQTVVAVSADEIVYSAESREIVTQATVEQTADTTAQLDTELAYSETPKDISPSDRPDSDSDTRPAVSTTLYDEREQYVEQSMTAESVAAIEIGTEEIATSTISGIGMTESLPELKADEPEAIHVLKTKPANVESTESNTWTNGLEKKSVEFVDDFTEALQSLIDVIDEEVESQIALEDGFDESISESAPIEDTEPVSPIALEVADTLRELSNVEKETVAPTLQEIIEKVQTLGALEATDATLEIVETTKEELRELVTTLFDQLDIKYETEDIDRFMAMLLRLDLVPLQEEVPEELEEQSVLEDEGTHEIKTQRQSFATLAVNVQQAAGRLIGKTALLMDSRHRIFEMSAGQS